MPERDFSPKALKRKAEEVTGKTFETPDYSDGYTGNSLPKTPVPPVQQPTTVEVPEELSAKMKIQPQEELYNIPIATIELPSGEYFYGNKIPGGRIKIKALEQKDIDILNTEHLARKNIAFDRAIDNCIVDPKISTNMLITADRVYLLFKIFELSKGTSKYTFTEKCPKCGQKNKITIDINDLEVKRMQLNENKFVVELPMCKRKVTYHMLTGNERKDVENKIKVLMSQTSASKLIDTTSTETLIKQIDEIEGVPMTQRSEFIRHMIYGDAVRLRKHMDENTPGIVPTYEFTCVNCLYEDTMVIPITMAFFNFDE